MPNDVSRQLGETDVVAPATMNFLLNCFFTFFQFYYFTFIRLLRYLFHSHYYTIPWKNVEYDFYETTLSSEEHSFYTLWHSHDGGTK